MRPHPITFALTALLLWSAAVGIAQEPSGPPTLENLLDASESKDKPGAAAAKAGATDSVRPAGILVRPEGGVQHPDLDKAWTEYSAAVAKARSDIRQEIFKQFDLATGKGDLDAALKWKAIGERFDAGGDIPDDSETKAIKKTGDNAFKKAAEDLTKVYESLVKTFTMDKKIEEAMAVRDESRSLGKSGVARNDPGGRKPAVATEKTDRAVASSGPSEGSGGRYRFFRIVAKKSSTTGWKALYRAVEFFDSDTGKILKGRRVTGAGENPEKAFDDDRETSYRTTLNPGPTGDWISLELPRPAAINRVRVSQFGADCNHVFDFDIQGSNNGRDWKPIMTAKEVPFEFDSETHEQTEWLSPKDSPVNGTSATVFRLTDCP
jgi:hypothetical protein